MLRIGAKLMNPHPRTLGRSRNRPCGFTIVEVLVSLVILSIGLLGIGKLVLYSSHANDSAYLRSQATELAYAILDDMRSNQAGAIAHDYDTALATAPVNPGFSCTLATACTTSASVAQYDVYVWKLRLNANSGLSPPGALPNGQGSVTTTYNGTVTTAVITVQWDDSAAQSAFAGVPLGTAAPMQVTLETVIK